MIYDCVIIGGGLAGLTCGISSLRKGMTTLILSNGMNALHFSSGSVDLMGFDSSEKISKSPFNEISNLNETNNNHPYIKAGETKIIQAMDFFTRELEQSGMRLKSKGKENLFHFTNLGVLKPTYLSQESSFDTDSLNSADGESPVALLNFSGFRDYFPQLAAANLKKSRLFRKRDLIMGEICLEQFDEKGRNYNEFRSIDIARIFNTERYLNKIAQKICEISGKAQIITLPSFLGIDNFERVHRKLEELTGKKIYELPTLPPSIPGLRMDSRLKGIFINAGGHLVSSDRVKAGLFRGKRLNAVVTENSGPDGIRGKNFLLATGSFLSGGLVSEYKKITEPVFNTDVFFTPERTSWNSESFFTETGHPFMKFGVETTDDFRAIIENSEMENLYCAGSVLGHYDPVREGSGGGVAVTTGYACAEIMAGRC